MQVSKRFSNPVWLIYPIVLLPLLSSLAAHFMSRDALIFVYFFVGLAVFASGLRLEASFADYFFPILIVAVALTTLMSITLSSLYVVGFDSHQEFALFQQVAQQGSWQPQVSILYNAALSVTILPTMMTTVSSLDGVLIFKIVYPLLFSMVPMILYKIYRRIMVPEAAFLSVFVFVSYPGTYGDMSQLGRQMLAELIMILLLWVQFSDLRKTRRGLLLVLLLTVGLVMAHYSLALIYFFLISFSIVASRIRRLGMEPFGSGSYVAISVLVGIGWFFLVAGGIVLQNISQAFGSVLAGMSEFFNPATRPYELTGALGLGSVNFGFLHLLNRATQYLVAICIIAGFLIFLRKSRKTRIEKALVPLMAASMVFLLASLLLPFLAATLVLSRFYQIALILLSPCFYFGATKIVGGIKWLNSVLPRHSRRIRVGRLLPAAILFSYLLFTSGWVWAITLDQPTSLVLDQERSLNYPDVHVRLSYYYWYSTPEDVAAARWISSQGVANLCGDFISRDHVLNSYGGYPRVGPTLPGCYGETAQGFQQEYEYVYISSGNSLLGVGVTSVAANIRSTYIFAFNGTKTSFANWDNRVYSDGAVLYTSLTT